MITTVITFILVLLAVVTVAFVIGGIAYLIAYMADNHEVGLGITIMSVLFIVIALFITVGVIK